jgi:hypothetical protein
MPEPTPRRSQYPPEAYFDIETLLSTAQAQRILLLGNIDPGFMQNHLDQLAVLQLDSLVHSINTSQIEDVFKIRERYDMVICLDVFEHLSKKLGAQLLAHIRDVVSSQYCICLPVGSTINKDGWQLNDLFAFALNRVNTFHVNDTQYMLFKYSLNNYKKTPDWLNADNWANPHMWGKYWW